MRLPGRGVMWVRRKWGASHNAILATLLAAVILGANVAFWLFYRKLGSAFGIGYHLPVILITIFVLYIVLDKWCKHADEDRRFRSAEGEDDPIAYDRAMMRGLRGALAAGRWACVILTLVLMVRLMGLKDLTNAAKILLALLFLYESVFLLISLAVRLIRRELQTAPELSVPMPGLGKGDLGVISYLEKNTGITMRSLWSIRLIKYVLPYAAMAMVVLLWGFSGVVKIDPHQQGAHYRLGHLREETLQPGLHMTLPWPFDSVEVYDTEVVSTMTIGYIADERADNIWTESHGGEEYRLLLGNGHWKNHNATAYYREQGVRYWIFQLINAVGVCGVMAIVLSKVPPEFYNVGFSISAAMLLLHSYDREGKTYPTTHHETLVVGYAMAATGGNVLLSIVFGMIANLIFLLFARYFNEDCDTHIDPPAVAIFACSLVLFTLF
jgi:hypothetical protein